MTRWLIQALLLDSNEKLFQVTSWKPTWGRFGIEWPSMLIDRIGHRAHVAPVWDRCRLRLTAVKIRELMMPLDPPRKSH
jgi:hypothetical protein